MERAGLGRNRRPHRAAARQPVEGKLIDLSGDRGVEPRRRLAGRGGQTDAQGRTARRQRQSL